MMKRAVFHQLVGDNPWQSNTIAHRHTDHMFRLRLI